MAGKGKLRAPKTCGRGSGGFEGCVGVQGLSLRGGRLPGQTARCHQRPVGVNTAGAAGQRPTVVGRRKGSVRGFPTHSQTAWLAPKYGRFPCHSSSQQELLHRDGATAQVSWRPVSDPTGQPGGHGPGGGEGWGLTTGRRPGRRVPRRAPPALSGRPCPRCPRSSRRTCPGCSGAACGTRASSRRPGPTSRRASPCCRPPSSLATRSSTAASTTEAWSPATATSSSCSLCCRRASP